MPSKRITLFVHYHGGSFCYCDLQAAAAAAYAIDDDCAFVAAAGSHWRALAISRSDARFCRVGKLVLLCASVCLLQFAMEKARINSKRRPQLDI